MSLPRALLNIAGAQCRHASRHWRRVEKMAGRVGTELRHQQELLAQAPARARAQMGRGRAVLERSAKRLERFDDHVVAPYRTERRVKRTLARAASGRRPIIAGPWTSEVGYEALYWVPFLRWAADRYGVPPHRIVAVSRGGTRSWYQGLAGQYVEIFDLIDPREFERQASARRAEGDQKQMAASRFDDELLRGARERLGIPEADVWHPGLMYQLFRAFWHGDRSVDHVLRHTDFRRVGLTAVEVALPPLPTRYTAVKFYTGPALPDTPRNRETLRRLIERLAARMPVVMLDLPWSVDEHRDFAFDDVQGVMTVRPSLDPKTNLGVQTAVIAGAERFVGTCGGLAWLAPLLGVDTVAVYEDDRFLTHHMYAARQVYRRRGAAAFSTLNLQALRDVGSPLS